MPKFLALTSRGLNEALQEELVQANFKNVEVHPDVVTFEGSWAEAYRAHAVTRIATRILYPVLDFTCYNEEDLYHNIFKRHDFTQYIKPDQTFEVEAHVREHRHLRDQRFVAMKTKDAIADQFRKKFDQRPSVAHGDQATMRVVVRVVRTMASIAIDLTGDSLSHRGYRSQSGEAPLRENIAAALVRYSGWTPDVPLVDPFCGSGTILIEAALAALNLGPTIHPRSYLYQKLLNYKATDWPAPVKAELEAPLQLFGFDEDERVLQKARANAQAAGVAKYIRFERCAVKDLKCPSKTPGFVITNPPYGERIGSKDSVHSAMKEFASSLKTDFDKWQAWILSGDSEATASLKLKAERKIPVWNGSIECRFLRYSIRGKSGSPLRTEVPGNTPGQSED